MAPAADERERELADAKETISRLQRELADLKLAVGSGASSAPPHLNLGAVHPYGVGERSPAVRDTSHFFSDYEMGLGLAPQRKPVNVCIPMSGLRSGPFPAAGYRFPKPLINIVGRPVLHWVIDALRLQPADAVWLAISDEIEVAHGVQRRVQRAFPSLRVHVVRLTVETCGWVETVVAMLRQMPLDLRSRRTLCIDCHTVVYGFDVLGALRELPENTGASFYCSFADASEHRPPGGTGADTSAVSLDSAAHAAAREKHKARGRFSYLQLGKDGEIVLMREKVAISSNINIGAYGFPSAAALLAAAESHLDAMLGQVRAGATEAAPEYHASTLITKLLAEGVQFRGVRVDDSAYASVGTPDELLEFIGRVSSVPVQSEAGDAPRGGGGGGGSDGLPTPLEGPGSRGRELLASTPRLRFCIDIDSTLLQQPSTPGAELQPVADNCDLVRALHGAGHYVIVQTSAGMESGHGNSGRAVAAAGLRILDALRRHDIPYDEIHFGKPAADFYIDSVTLNAGAGTLAKDIGWHAAEDLRTIEGGIRARSFNQIALVGDKHIIKSSSRKVLAGEAYFYAHIPPPLAHCFPTLVEIVDKPEVDTMSIVQTRVAGTTFSHMLVDLTLTSGRLRLLLDALHALHTYTPAEGGAEEGGAQASVAELCANYARKVGSRFAKHREMYESFRPDGLRPDGASGRILDFLQSYEAGRRCQHAWFIHGDPVFSNAILGADGQVRLIDMRGALGERLTTQGDCHYDLSKVYQSLCGYDFMLLDKPITEGTAHYLASLRETFWGHVRAKYPSTAERDVRLLTAAHFFCIVPLHEEREHQERYLRASESMLVVEGLL